VKGEVPLLYSADSAARRKRKPHPYDGIISSAYWLLIPNLNLYSKEERKMSILPKKDKPITFRIDDETYEKIEELVKQNKTSVSLEIRKMIDFYLESKERLEK